MVKKYLSFKADREDIADNENFGPGDGFVDIGSGKVYVLKTGWQQRRFYIKQLRYNRFKKFILGG